MHPARPIKAAVMAIIMVMLMGGAPLPCRAQGTMTLDECITYALEHNLNVRARRYDTESSRIRLTGARDSFLPTVSAGASQSFSFGRSVAEDNIKVSSNASSFSWNVNAQVPLFDGLKNWRTLQGARLSLTDMLLQEEVARDDVTLNVIAAYLQALLCDELAAVARTQVELSAAEVERQQTLLDAGKVPELDLLQAQSTLAQDRLSLVEAENDCLLALLDLRQLLMMPQEQPLAVTPPGDDEATLVPDADEVYRNAMASNSSILSRRQNILIARQNILTAKTGYLPTLSLGASVGSSFTHFSTLPTASFSAQMRDNMTEMVGFSLSIPLFDAFSTRNSVRSAKVNALVAELELEQTATELQKTITQAYTRACAARSKAQAAATAEEAAKAALEAMTTKLTFGRATQTDFDRAKTEYVSAASTTIRARYEYLLRTRILRFYNKQ